MQRFKVRVKDKRLVLGLTGNIACGKSSVSDILQSFGSPLIHFDLIALQVVEPDTKAVEQIVDYFGKQVLRDDGWLDRDKLSKIVFGQMEKRKKLENSTHPPICDGLNSSTKSPPKTRMPLSRWPFLC